MQYFGGKFRLADEIVSVLNKYRKEGQIFLEPFVGGANIVSKMTGKRTAYDIHYELIEMYKAIQNGWFPPDLISKEYYEEIRDSKNIRPCLKGFVGFGCSFAGKYFGGYANSGDRNYCVNARNSVLKKMETCKDVVFECKDYRKITPKDCLIYCDPPFLNTIQYSNGKFDSVEFWGIMREWSKNNIVIVSEYQAPDDFECIWKRETKLDIRNRFNQREKRIEKLFKFKQ